MRSDGFKKTAQRISLILLLLVCLLSADTALGFAQQYNPQQQQQQDARRQQMMERFGVTPEQMQQFKAIREGARAEAQALQQQIRQKRQALMQYVQSPDANEAQAMAMNRELNAMTARVGELRIQTVFRMKEVMTPEQFDQFVRQREQARGRIMDQMQGRMQQRREGGGGFQGGPRQQPGQRFGGGQDGPRRRWQPQGN